MTVRSITIELIFRDFSRELIFGYFKREIQKSQNKHLRFSDAKLPENHIDTQSDWAFKGPLYSW